MKKQINIYSLIFLPLFATLLFGLTLTAYAQVKYKVGDSVEVDTLQTSKDPEKSLFWRKGKIIKINEPDNPYGSYIVKLDKDGREMVFSFTWTQWMRVSKEDAEEKVQPEANNAAKDNKTTEEQAKKEEPKKDENSCQPPDETGGTSQNDIFKHLIQARYEHKPKVERDFTTTVTFQSFKPGATHKWRPGVGGESPDGPGGKAGTTIYPVKAVYTVCSDYPGYEPTNYRGEIQKHQDNNTFYCFKNEFGEWQCNLAEGKTGELIFIKK